MEVSSQSHENSCLHCGLPCNGDFCCSGCEVIYKTIQSLGLQDFYRYRDLKISPSSISSPSTSSYQEFQDDEFQKKYVRNPSESERQANLFLEGIHCAGCVWLIEKLPLIHPGVSSASVNLSSGIIDLSWDPSRTSLADIAKRLDSLGYRSHAPSITSISKGRKRENLLMITRIAVAAFCSMNAMLPAISLYEGFYSGMDEKFESYFKWISLILTLPVVTFSAWPFYERSISALKHLKLHIDLPISLALISGFLLSLLNTILGRPYVYFDSISIVIFLLLSGRYLQRMAIEKARLSAGNAPSLIPSRAQRLQGNEFHQVRTDLLKEGDIIEIRAGERVPVDCIIIEGDSHVDNSVITGESLAVECSPESEILAGALNIDGILKAQVKSSSDESRLSRILSTVEQSYGKRPGILEFSDRIGFWFTFSTLSLALVTFAIWYSDGLYPAFEHSIALLLVSCPCAIGLATPAAFSIATGRAARKGILIKGMDTIERLAKAKSLYFDKTGTLSTGTPVIESAFFLKPHTPDQCSRISAMAQVAPSHPSSISLVHWLQQNKLHRDAAYLEGSAKHIPGKGVILRDANENVFRLGSIMWMKEEQILLPPEISSFLDSLISEAKSPLIYSEGNVAMAAFGLTEEPRKDIAEVLSDLKASGRTLNILSGDINERLVKFVDDLDVEVHIQRGELGPEEKKAIIEKDPAFTAMIGDGINDSGAMASAGVSVGMKGGLQSIVDVVDVFLMKDDPALIKESFLAADRTMKLVWENLYFSAIYNLAGASAAMLGLVNPLLAAILMPLSSITVIANALRKRTF